MEDHLRCSLRPETVFVVCLGVALLRLCKQLVLAFCSLHCSFHAACLCFIVSLPGDRFGSKFAVSWKPRKDSEQEAHRTLCFPCSCFTVQVASSLSCINYQGLKEISDPTGAFSKCASSGDGAEWIGRRWAETVAVRMSTCADLAPPTTHLRVLNSSVSLCCVR